MTLTHSVYTITIFSRIGDISSLFMTTTRLLNHYLSFDPRGCSCAGYARATIIYNDIISKRLQFVTKNVSRLVINALNAAKNFTKNFSEDSISLLARTKLLKKFSSMYLCKPTIIRSPFRNIGGKHPRQNLNSN